MSLRDLDLDFRTGKVAEADYNIMKAKYEHEAIEVLRQLDHISDKKNAKSKSSEKAHLLKNQKEIFCSKCGHKASKSDKFCSICGHSLIKII
jgi:rubrerythrin